MILYNVTVKIDLDVHDLWLRWMKEEHIPRVMETGCFVESKLFVCLKKIPPMASLMRFNISPMIFQAISITKSIMPSV